MRTTAHSRATLQPTAMQCHQTPAAKLTRLQTASMVGRLPGSCPLPKKLAQRAADDDEIPASFCCPITQVSKALDHVLLKHNVKMSSASLGLQRFLALSCLFGTGKHADGCLDSLLRVYLCAAGADAEPCGRC